MQELGGMKVIKARMEKLAGSMTSTWKLQAGYLVGLCVGGWPVLRFDGYEWPTSNSATTVS